MTSISKSPKMDFAYEVYVGPKSDEDSILVYRAFTLDEACGIALGLFRTSNVPNFRVIVFSLVAKSDMITFIKE